MKKVLLMLVFMITSIIANASHMMGGDITYECISPGKYKMTIKVYRDCRGIPFNNPSIAVFCADGGNISNSINVSYTRTAINDITPICLNGTPPCNPQNTMSNEGVEEHIFEAIVDFNSAPYKAIKDAGCCEVKIKVEQQARNGAITNLIAGNFYTDAMINICNVGTKCNTSPQLSIPPVSYLCCNQPFIYNNGVREVIDGDSLSYDLVNPLNGNGSNETYQGSFTAQIPMSPFCLPPGNISCKPLPNAKPPRGFYFDRETGDLIFTPTKCDEVGVIVIQITEWRKDSATKKWLKIGYTKRDMQLIVKKCPDNNPPYLSIKNKYAVCEGNKICFTILAKDDPYLPNQIVADTVALTWNYGIPGGTFRIIDPKAREKEAEFCWQTKVGDARPNAYSFTATAKDNNCSNPSQANKGYMVIVNPKARAKRQYDILDCGKLKFYSHPEDTVNYRGKYLFEWTIRDSTNELNAFKFSRNQNDSFKFKRGGKYIITHQITNPPYYCPTIYQDTVIIPPILNVELTFGKDTFVCAGDSLLIKPIVSYGYQPFKYRWESPIDSFNKKDTLNYFSIKPTKPSTVVLRLTDRNKCIDSDTINIWFQPLPKVNLGPDKRICTYQSITLDAQNADTLKYYWMPDGDSTRTKIVNVAGKYIAKVIDSLGCNTSDTMELFVNDTVVAFAGLDREICIFDTLKLKGTRLPKGHSKVDGWRDINTNTNVSNDSLYSVKITTPTPKQYEYYVKITQKGITCECRDTINILVNLLPTFNFKGIPPRCYAEGAINLTTNGTATALSGDKTQTEPIVRYFQNKKPSWITGGPVKVNTFKYDYPLFITNAQVPKTGLKDTICYDYTDYKGCYNKECKPIKLNTNPVVDLRDKTHCQKAGLLTLDNMVKLPTSKIGGIQTFKCIDGPKLDVIATANTLPVTYTFDPGTENEPDRTGKYKIEYCFKDAITGCQTCDTAFVTVVKLPEIQFEPLPLLCINDSLLALDSFASDKNTKQRFNGEWKTIEYSYSRNPNDKISKSILNKKYFNPSYGPGVFMIKLSDNSSGCLAEDSIELIVNGLPIIKLNIPDTLCSSNSPTTLINEQPSGNVGTWSGISVTGRQFDPSISPKTKQYEKYYKVKFNYTNPLTGCSNFSIDSIIIQSQPEVQITVPKPYQQCEDIVFDLTSTKKWCSNVKWTTNGDGKISDSSKLKMSYTHGLQDTINNNVILTIQTIKEGVCPEAIDDISLIIEPYPQFDFIGSPLIQCEPGLVDFTSAVRKPKSNLIYHWDFGNRDTSNIANPLNIRYDTANRQWYDVVLIIRNQWGSSGACVTTLFKDNYIKILPKPKSSFTSEPNFFTTVAFPKFKFLNKTQIRWGLDSVKYLWNFNNKDLDDTSTQINPIKIYPIDTTVYLVNLMSSFTYSGVTCYDSITALRKVGPDVIVFIPTIFSPEGTGPDDNNKFRVVISGEKTFHIEVFNRWGEILWKSDNKYDGWDGTYRGVNAQQDVYAWVVKVTAYDDEEYQYEGTITLVR